MTRYVAKQIKFRNGERHSVLSRVGDLPVHEATLFLARFRTRGRAANTIHVVCRALALFHRWQGSEIDLLARLRQGQFLTIPELHRLADTVQYRTADSLEDDEVVSAKPQIIDLNSVRAKRSRVRETPQAVGAANQATRLRYIAQYLTFLANYFAVSLSPERRAALEADAKVGVALLTAQVPKVSHRATLGARQGLSKEAQDRLVAVVHPDSSENPWKRGFVRQRNWLIVVLLLATGMRRGELLNIRISDLAQRDPKLDIVRRPDSSDDPRMLQPTPKTRERTIELRASIMKQLHEYVASRHTIKAARKHPFLVVSDDGEPLAYKSVDKIFADVRRACPDLSIDLSSHVMRHTWNERFSEAAEAMQLEATAEERARNEQQGWAYNSKTSQVYTRRHTDRKGRELSLKLQEKLESSEQ